MSFPDLVGALRSTMPSVRGRLLPNQPLAEPHMAGLGFERCFKVFGCDVKRTGQNFAQQAAVVDQRGARRVCVFGFDPHQRPPAPFRLHVDGYRPEGCDSV